MDFHKSDCATHNEPESQNGECNCGFEILENSHCSFLDWIHSEGWQMFRSKPEMIWFKIGGYSMKTNKQLFYEYHNETFKQ